MKRGGRHSKSKGEYLRDFILGGQDGLVNVLGIILGVATATMDERFIIVAGLSALFAESISMGAVAFTSSKAARDYYYAELERERLEIKKFPEVSYLLMVLGSYDLLVEVYCKDLAHLAEFISDRLQNVENVRSTETLMIAKTYKLSHLWSPDFEAQEMNDIR